MRQQDATTTVTAPLATVERFLADVEQWPRFILGLDAVRRTGHERYVFCVRDGGDRRESTVCVRRDGLRHRVTWRSLEGPEYSGSITLSSAGESHTSVRLELRCHPGTLVAGIAEMVMPRRDRAVHDLAELEAALAGAR